MMATDVDTLRVFLCDDQHEIREALRAVIGALPGLQVTGEAATGDECLDALRAEAADLVVLDVHLPGGGPALAAAIRQEHPEVVIVVFSAHLESDVRDAMLRAGADEFVPKTGRLAPLRAALLRHAPAD